MNKTTEIIIATVIAFLLSTLLSKILIPILTRLKAGQPIREEGPRSHQSKGGTPTIGGLIFLLSILITSLIFSNSVSFPILFITFSSAIIGFVDDFAKVKKQHNAGLSPLQKLFAQFAVTAVFLLMVTQHVPQFTSVIIPFTQSKIDLGIFYYPFFFIFMMGISNAVNITDGLDGLATGVTAIVTIFFAFITLNFEVNFYVLPFIVFASLLGFLFFNFNPAKVFMGDTGSLALGGFVGGIATMLNMQLFIIIVGIFYCIEIGSVMIQVAYFKYTKRKYGEGRRIFKMSPFHHHLEAVGWNEKKIVLIAYLITAVACLIGYLAF